MKPRMLQLLVFVLLMGTWGFAEALEPLKLYDNFEQAPIDINRWVGGHVNLGGAPLEVVRRTIQNPEGHHLRLLNRHHNLGFFSDAGTSLGILRVAFRESHTVTAIRSRVQVRNFKSTGCPQNLTPTSVAAQLLGFFFNTNGTVLGNATNDVIAGVAVRRRSDSTDPPDVLEIFYFVGLCSDPDCVNSPFLGSGVLGTVRTGQWVRLLMQWDKDGNQFIFQRGSQPPVFVSYEGFSDTADPGFQLKSLDAIQFVANCTGDPHSPRPVGMVDARFDNVFVNESAFP
jgi:hypothetical protein